MQRSFSRDQAAAVARLARLELSETELDLIARQLADILAYADQIRALDASELAGGAPERGAPLRDDSLEPPLSRDDVLDQAPAAACGFFKVPRVLS